MYKVKVDRDLCIGIGNCVAIAPTVFQLDSDNKLLVIDPSSVTDEVLMKAASSCPENAILLEDDKGNQVYP
ncbi:MAG: ferredoxin [Dehalococcoidales bacterium]|nr:ferredoxin [Dehalococcoidales bacterium]